MLALTETRCNSAELVLKISGESASAPMRLTAFLPQLEVPRAVECKINGKTASGVHGTDGFGSESVPRAVEM